MANKTKVDMNYAKSLISANASRSSFVNDISAKYNVSKQYASFLYYKLKKPDSNNAEIPNSGLDQQTSTSTETISPEDVSVKNQTPNEEAEDLKKAYSKLFEEKTGVSPEEAKEPEEENIENIPSEEEQGGEFGGAGPEEAEKSLKIKLGALLKQIGVAVNDRLIWKERPLGPDEIENIESVSNDIEANFGEGLEGPYSPYYNYILFTLVAPVIARIDLLPEKMRKLNEWMKSSFGKRSNAPAGAQQPQQTTPQNQQQQPQQQAQAQSVEQTLGNLSSAQLELIRNLKSQGYTVEDDFDPNLPIDYEAFRNKIARNVKINI
ncbi:MAG: hypothetical protein QXH07_02365 [Thermoplasmata archaeon]